MDDAHAAQLLLDLVAAVKEHVVQGGDGV